MYILIIIILISIPFILALFGKDEFVIEREIIINRPNQDVFNYIRFLKNAEHYNKWVMTDPNMKTAYRGTDGAPGFVYAWDSDNKNVGKGEQEITNISEGERVDYEIRFIKPFASVSTAHLTTVATDGDNTKVKWVFAGQKNYIMKVMHLVLNLEKVLGKDLQTSLGNLKNVLERI